MNEKTSPNLALLVFGAVGIAVVAVLWKAAAAMGLPFATTARVLLTSAFAVGIYGFVLYASKKEEWDIPVRVSLVPTLPLLLAVLWFLWWPALDQWSNQALNHGPVDTPSLFFPEEYGGPKWYGTWYAKLGGILLCLSMYLPALWNRNR